MRKIFACLLLFFCSSLSFAQTTGSTLPNATSIRYSIKIDAGDTIWGGTNNSGLSKYFNGIQTYYNTSNSGISSNRCQALSIDSTGNIWSGGHNGISIFNHVNWTLLNTGNSGIPGDTVLSILHTANGAWIGTSRGLCYYDGNTWITYSTGNSGLLNDSVICIAVNNNTIYTGHPNGISRLDGNWTTWDKTTTGLGSPFMQMLVCAGRLWVSQNSLDLSYLDQNNFVRYLSLLNNFSDRQQYYNNYNRQNGLASDDNGNILFVSPNQYRSSLVRILPSLKIEISLINPITFSFSSLFANSVCKGNEFYISGFNGGVKKIDFDTTAFLSKAYLAGNENDYLDVNNATARI
jgi:hypothetical protein